MTQFWIRIAVWSLLHEPMRISESSHGSAFESPVYRVHNEHKFRPGLGRLLPVWIARTRPGTATETHIYSITH